MRVMWFFSDTFYSYLSNFFIYFSSAVAAIAPSAAAVITKNGSPHEIGKKAGIGFAHQHHVALS